MHCESVYAVGCTKIKMLQYSSFLRYLAVVLLKIQVFCHVDLERVADIWKKWCLLLLIQPILTEFFDTV